MDKKEKPPTEEDITVWIESEQMEFLMRQNPELFNVDNLHLPQTVKEHNKMVEDIGWQKGNIDMTRLKKWENTNKPISLEGILKA